MSLSFWFSSAFVVSESPVRSGRRWRDTDLWWLRNVSGARHVPERSTQDGKAVDTRLRYWYGHRGTVQLAAPYARKPHQCRDKLSFSEPDSRGSLEMLKSRRCFPWANGTSRASPSVALPSQTGLAACHDGWWWGPWVGSLVWPRPGRAWRRGQEGVQEEEGVKSFVASCWHLSEPSLTCLAPDEIQFVGQSTMS